MGNIDIFIYNIYKYFLNIRRFEGHHGAVSGRHEAVSGHHKAFWRELSPQDALSLTPPNALLGISSATVGTCRGSACIFPRSTDFEERLRPKASTSLIRHGRYVSRHRLYASRRRRYVSRLGRIFFRAGASELAILRVTQRRYVQ